MMSLLWTESFDYSFSGGTFPVGRYDLHNNPQISSSIPRTGIHSVYLWISTFYFYKVLTASSRLIIGFGYQLADSIAGNLVLLNLTSNGVVVGELLLNPSTKTFLYTRRDSGPTQVVLGTSSSSLFSNNAWRYFELNVLIGSGTSGSVELRMDGVTVLSASSVNTQSNHGSAASGTVNGFLFGYSNGFVNGNGMGSPVALVDDMYVCNGAGSVNNTFLGDVRVEYLRPNGAGNSTTWTPIGAASNWDCVDEVNQDGDSTYVTSTSPGAVDLYALGDLSSNPVTIHGVQTTQLARKLSGGSVSTRLVTRSGGTNYFGPAIPRSDTYTATVEVRETNPNTGTAWTKTTVDAMETGIEIA